MCVSPQLNFKKVFSGKVEGLGWAGLSWRDRSWSSPQGESHKSALLLLPRVDKNQVNSQLYQWLWEVPTNLTPCPPLSRGKGNIPSPTTAMCWALLWAFSSGVSHINPVTNKKAEKGSQGPSNLSKVMRLKPRPAFQILGLIYKGCSMNNKLKEKSNVLCFSVRGNN